jgi:ArsR family transcriptional regulator
MRDRLNSKVCCKYLKALADPDRLRIIQTLQQGPLPVGKICQRLAAPLANVSHHLKQLRTAGLVARTRKGRFVFYALADNIVEKGSKLPLNVLDFGCCSVRLGHK